LMVTLVAVVTSVTPPSVSDGWELMLWHDSGTCRRGDQARPCRLALYP
jgi:hypothetical protein